MLLMSVYEIMLLRFRQGSIGKRAMGIYVAMSPRPGRRWRQAVLRTTPMILFGFGMLSSLWWPLARPITITSTGFLLWGTVFLAASSPEGRSLWDRMASTRVYRGHPPRRAVAPGSGPSETFVTGGS